MKDIPNFDTFVKVKPYLKIFFDRKKIIESFHISLEEIYVPHALVGVMAQND